MVSSRPSAEEFERLQADWYSRLRKEEFSDIEDTSRKDRPLKEWVGSARVLDRAARGTEFSLLLSRKEEFTTHPQFSSVCDSLCEHWNSSLSPDAIKQVWRLHCEGESLRTIAERLSSSFKTVHRTILKITEWMNMIGIPEDAPEVELDPLTVVLRDFDPKIDEGLLYASWRNALWYDGSHALHPSQSAVFYSNATKSIRALLKEGDVLTRIATLTTDPCFIVGYAVLQRDHLHWVYVKPEYRGIGVGKLLAKEFETIAEPLTRIGKSIATRHQMKVKKEENENE